MYHLSLPDGVAWFISREDSYPTWIIALTFALASGLSLPLGALFGILVTPAPASEEQDELSLKESKRQLVERGNLRKQFVGYCLAFGAGSLLFAVTIELYGKQMRRLHNHGYLHHVVGICVTTIAAVLGGVLYTATDRWLRKVTSGKRESDTESTALLSSKQSPHEHEEEVDRSAAGLSMWLGVFIDGLPEGILMGFLAAEHHLSMVLVISLLIANFPEAFSSACLLKEARWSSWKIFSMWTFCFLLTASLATISCLLCPVHLEGNLWIRIFECLIEGLAGGAMLACVTAVMLPEAYEIHNDMIGILCLSGFLVSVALKVTGGVASDLAHQVHPWEAARQEISDQMPSLGM
mmetsp:Transcript_62345/g.114547  ORF Transcript_62345/g.114547 Transcript_62345/m.114547 type:complete len:351 (+) Transcript_62345:100-1152(+)